MPIRGISGHTIDTRGGTLKSYVTRYVNSLMIGKGPLNTGLLNSTNPQGSLGTPETPEDIVYDPNAEARFFIVGISEVDGPDICSR